MASTAPSAQSIANSSVTIEEEIHVQAPLEVTFEALLEQVGPAGTRPDGTHMEMKLEAWPGGRWFRDLGGNNGHLWGHVQAIKRPTLLEMCGPLFMSYPVLSNVQYRLEAVDGGTLIKFHHLAFGLIPDNIKEGMTKGWKHINDQARIRAEAKRAR